ncbi:MAG TPA: restriction endonuclease subunit S, partial [candidate division Zixibacteria bacterium]|nr:restriction endonuclease subunit S [candidate division Zixibacteria bacterium]
MNESALSELPGGWVWTKLGEISEKINPGFPSGKHNKESRGIPHLRPMNINASGEIDFSVVKYVQPDSYDPLLKGDVLFNNTNSPELLGKTAYIKDDTNWAYSNHMTRIRLNQSFLNYAWISYYLHNLFLKGFFKMSCTHHVNQASINSTFLSQNVPIPLPPLPEQRRIVAKIEELFTKLDAGVSELKKTQAQLKRYRQSVLKAACEGKLVPTEAELAKAEGREYESADVLLALINEIRKRNTKGKYIEMPTLDISDLPKLPEGWLWVQAQDVCNWITNGYTPKANKMFQGNGEIPYIK